MASKKQPINVGCEIAKILAEWRPNEGSYVDVADAIMSALEQYTMSVAPGMESELRTIFNVLEQEISERRRSF